MTRSLATAVALALVVAACGGDSAVSSNDDLGPALVEQSSGWELLAPSPLSPRTQAAIAWTGAEIVVFGGTTFLCPASADCGPPDEDPSLSDGAAYDPRSERWRPITPAPMPVPYARPVTVGEDIFALVTPFAAAASTGPHTTLLRYRSADDAWDAFDVPSQGPVGDLVATTNDLFVVQGTDEVGEHPDLRFNLTDESWTEVPADPLSPSFDRQIVAVDERLVLLARELTPSPGGADGPSFIHAALLHNDIWTELPPADVIGNGPIAVVDDRVILGGLGCSDGGETNNYGRCVPHGGVLDLSAGSWSPLPGTPTSSRSASTSGVRSDTGVTLISLGNADGGSWFLDATTGTWTMVPALGGREDGAIARDPTGAGPYGVVFGGSRSGPNSHGELLGDAYLWRP